MKQIKELITLIDKAIKEKKDFIPFVSLKKIQEILLTSNEIEMLEYHYSLLNIKGDASLYYSIRTTFEKRPKEIIEPYLLKKLETEQDSTLKADIIQLLGGIGSEKILPFALQNIKTDIRDIRYRCIIVIGWVGNKTELPVLYERLINEPDDELRGYAATAMRQLWFKKKASSEDILPYLYAAIQKEEKAETLQMIIIVIQDLTKTKFGLQERINDATITGDILKAKAKILKKLFTK